MYNNMKNNFYSLLTGALIGAMFMATSCQNAPSTEATNNDPETIGYVGNRPGHSLLAMQAAQKYG